MKRLALIFLFAVTSAQAVTGLEIAAGVALTGWLASKKCTIKAALVFLSFGRKPLGVSADDCSSGTCSLPGQQLSTHTILDDQNSNKIIACDGKFLKGSVTQTCYGQGRTPKRGCLGVLTVGPNNTFACDGSMSSFERTECKCRPSCDCK